MKNKKTTTEQGAARKKRLYIDLVIVAVIVGIIGFIYFWFTYNYAQDALGPIEAAMAKEGATKVCARGDNGHGPDNQKPWADAIYQVPGSHQQATETVRRAASAAGFSLVVDYPPINREDNSFYIDKTSKKSNYLGLGSGNVELLVEVYGSSVPADGNQCGVQSSANAPKDKTAVEVQINLPSF